MARKLDYSDSTDFFDKVPKERRRKSSALRQKKHRLKDKEIKLVQGEIGYTGFFFVGNIKIAAEFSFRFLAGQVAEIQRSYQKIQT